MSGDPDHPYVTYRRGAAGVPVPVVRGTGIRVQSLVVAVRLWGWTSTQTAVEYDLAEAQVNDALAFYDAHRVEMDAVIKAELEMEEGSI